ncbi:hypothetical protein BurJ1DRAFT_3244 [Burkholderiales bacterium JOSHI_001]|nr:hypothetical protein BurJ1DRAFT_3244 [Burkholderiales bacterium JOSHI_001]
MTNKPLLGVLVLTAALLPIYWSWEPSVAGQAAAAQGGAPRAAQPVLPEMDPKTIGSGPPATAPEGRAPSASGVAALTPPSAAATAVLRPPLPRPETYKLTRTLPSQQGEQTIHLEGRTERLIGTRTVADERGPQVILITRDEDSGALSYWQSGLRFALKPGQDHEAFLRDRPKFTRRFVNADFADVALDAADVADAYRSLAADPRVAKVRLLALPRRDKLK